MMVRVTYIEQSGSTHEIELAEGESLMRGALDNGIPGIDGDCGGQCACGTCHIYIDEQWLPIVGGIEGGSMEADMLQLVDDARYNSRLSCQIMVGPDLDGLRVLLPAGQH